MGKRGGKRGRAAGEGELESGGEDQEEAYHPHSSATATTSGDGRRVSTRRKQLSEAMKQVDEETRQQVKNARLEALANDDYGMDLDTKKGDDDDFVMTSDEDDDVAFVKKKRKKKTELREKRDKQERATKKLEQIIKEANLEGCPSHIPTYLTAAVKPSRYPARHFCHVCGFFSNYTCTRCGMRYCSARCLGQHKETRCLKFAD
eukprot:tig00021123_g18516.t1